MEIYSRLAFNRLILSRIRQIVLCTYRLLMIVGQGEKHPSLARRRWCLSMEYHSGHGQILCRGRRMGFETLDWDGHAGPPIIGRSMGNFWARVWTASVAKEVEGGKEDWNAFLHSVACWCVYLFYFNFFPLLTLFQISNSKLFFIYFYANIVVMLKWRRKRKKEKKKSWWRWQKNLG